jgi:hypothetical protein
MDSYVKLIKRRDAAVQIMDSLNLDLKAQTEKGFNTSITLSRLAERRGELTRVNTEIEQFLFGK